MIYTVNWRTPVISRCLAGKYPWILYICLFCIFYDFVRYLKAKNVLDCNNNRFVTVNITLTIFRREIIFRIFRREIIFFQIQSYYWTHIWERKQIHTVFRRYLSIREVNEPDWNSNPTLRLRGLVHKFKIWGITHICLTLLLLT